MTRFLFLVLAARHAQKPRAFVPLLLVVAFGVVSGTTFAKPMRGFLVFGHEARTFQPCGDNKTFWISAPAAVREQLKTRYRALANSAYEAVYVELEGEFLDQPPGAFARDYDGTIEVTELRSISRVGDKACQSKEAVAESGSDAISQGKTFVFVCNQQSVYTVRASETEAWLFLPEGTLRLPAVPGEQARKYSNGAFELRIEGELARLGQVGGRLQSCRNDRRRAIWEQAKLDGADFRAVGNEPGWHLVVLEGSRIVLVTDYGASRVELPLPEPTVDPDARRTRWDAGELVLEVVGHPCQDSMSGEQFDTEVVVTWRGQTLKGCGRALH